MFLYLRRYTERNPRYLLQSSYVSNTRNVTSNNPAVFFCETDRGDIAPMFCDTPSAFVYWKQHVRKPPGDDHQGDDGDAIPRSIESLMEMDPSRWCHQILAVSVWVVEPSRSESATKAHRCHQIVSSVSIDDKRSHIKLDKLCIVKTNHEEANIDIAVHPYGKRKVLIPIQLGQKYREGCKETPPHPQSVPHPISRSSRSAEEGTVDDVRLLPDTEPDGHALRHNVIRLHRFEVHSTGPSSAARY